MYQKGIKRAIDVVLSLFGLILASWLYGLIILAIKLDDPGPAFFRQKRVGKGKTYFFLVKFRSMKMCTPHDMPTHLLEDPEQYITRVGKFLRKTSLDEIPQLWNILKGDMSVIGPRPALWNQEDLLAERDKYGANDVRPGLSGWAQICGRDTLPIEEKARLDGEYVEKMSFLFDCRCFFGTAISALRGEGVVEGGTGELQKHAEEQKKYLIVTNHSYMLWRFRKELIAELQRTGEVVISTPFVGHEDDFRAMGCRLIETQLDRRSINPKTDLKLYRFYRTLIRTERPDLVVTYSIKPNIYASYACKKCGVPYCVNVQGLGTAFQKPLIAQLVTVMYRKALKKARTVFFENEGNAQEFLNRRIIPQTRVTVLKGAGINLEEYPLRPYPSEADGVRFLYLGRIMKEKGMDELFEAAQTLKKKYGDAVRFDLVGFFEDAYKDTVERLSEAGVVCFHGFQSDPRPFYAMSHCVVLPSYHEGMSNVLLEAAASGRAVITSDIPGCREALQNGVSGLLCKPRDAQSLTEQLEHFLRLAPEERAAMGEQGRRFVEKGFDKKAVVRATLNALLPAREPV